jgi:hypothetical protein
MADCPRVSLHLLIMKVSNLIFLVATAKRFPARLSTCAIERDVRRLPFDKTPAVKSVCH